MNKIRSAKAEADERAVFGETSIQRQLLAGLMEGLLKDQQRSFHRLMEILPEIVNESGIRTATDTTRKREMTLELRNPRIGRPQVVEADGTVRYVLPRECRACGWTYAVPLLTTVVLTYNRLEPAPAGVAAAAAGGGSQWIRIPIEPPRILHDAIPCYFPCMVGSRYCNLRFTPDRRGECLLSPGGSYIVGGFDRVVMELLNRKLSQPIVTASKNPRFALVCECRSAHKGRQRNTSTMKIALTTEGEILCEVPFLKTLLPLPVLLRLLGFTTPEAVRRVIWPEGPAPAGSLAAQCQELTERGIEHPLFVEPLGVAMREIGKASGFEESKAEKSVAYQISTECLPQVGYELDDPTQADTIRLRKAVYLGRIARRMTAMFVDPERFPPDQRDHLNNKFSQLPHMTLAIMWRQHFQEFMNKMRKRLFALIQSEKSFDLAAEIAKYEFTKTIVAAFTRGTTTVRTVSKTTEGTIQLRQSPNYLAQIAHLLRVIMPMNKDGKYLEPRKLPPSAWGLICPAHTPEGQEVGLVNSKAIGCRVRIGTPAEAIHSALERLPGFEPLRHWAQLPGGRALVIVDGDPLGVCHRRSAFVEAAREARRHGYLPRDCSITSEMDGVHVNVADGELLFAALRVSELPRVRDLLRVASAGGSNCVQVLTDTGVLEWLSAAEAEECLVASTVSELRAALETGDPEYTHLLLHPSQILGLAAAMIPFPDHDQAPRLTYQTNMATQAMSRTYLRRPEESSDAIEYELWYLQRPVTETDAEEVFVGPPMGTVMFVAIGDLRGMTSEDSLVMNRAAIQRGMARLTVRRRFTTSLAELRDAREILGNPILQKDPPVLSLQAGVDYSRVGHDGLPLEGTRVFPNQVIVGKWLRVGVVDETGAAQVALYDRSLVYPYMEPAVVDHVLITSTADGRREVHVVVRIVREPILGDKFTAPHGQKGTLGLIADPEDMPTVAEGPMAGCTPDLIFSPQCLAGRMTLGMVWELVGGTLGLARGQRVDATPFQHLDLQELLEGTLSKVSMMNGATGEILEIPWQVGFLSIQRLRHMVMDKVHARRTGPRDALTGQPNDGRKEGGGLRVGEMEGNALKGHGAMATLLGRTRDGCDPYWMHVCCKCGGIAEPKREPLRDMVARAASAASAASETGEAGEAAGDTILRTAVAVCRFCRSEETTRVLTRYTAKLLAFELLTIGVKVSFAVIRGGEGEEPTVIFDERRFIEEAQEILRSTAEAVPEPEEAEAEPEEAEPEAEEPEAEPEEPEEDSEPEFETDSSNGSDLEMELGSDSSSESESESDSDSEDESM